MSRADVVMCILTLQIVALGALRLWASRQRGRRRLEGLADAAQVIVMVVLGLVVVVMYLEAG
jgi:uncharacterized membrane protein YidH (DUF202 family)